VVAAQQVVAQAGQRWESVVGDGDLVVMVCRREEFRGRPRASGTWAARIDAARIDAAGTEKLGVPPAAMSPVTGPQNPRWYEKTGETPQPGADKALDKLPVNTWVRIWPPNNPRLNRAWGTTVLDPARDQIIQWGGGHAAYSGNDVLHYSIRTNRCSTGSFYPELALNWNRSMLFPPMPATFSGRPYAQHGYHNYGFDAGSKKIVAFSRSAGRFYVYDPLTRDWQGTFGPQFARPGERGWTAIYYNTTCVPTPGGLAAWMPERGLLRFDAEALAWKKLPVAGALPQMSVDNQGIAYDSGRDRFLCFCRHLKGNVTACDGKTGKVSLLAPAGAGAVTYRPRETIYAAHVDGVLVGACPKLSDGRAYWLFYDCAQNAWLGLHLPGKGVGAGFSLGLMYDAKRKLIWAADACLNLAVLRLDLKTAETKPLAKEIASLIASLKRGGPAGHASARRATARDSTGAIPQAATPGSGGICPWRRGSPRPAPGRRRPATCLAACP